jgi:hypothetical protein
MHELTEEEKMLIIAALIAVSPSGGGSNQFTLARTLMGDWDLSPPDTLVGHLAIVTLPAVAIIGGLMTTAAQVAGVLNIAKALLDTVKEMGDRGAIAGPMYAACIGIMSLEQFEAIMKLLVDSGRLRKEGHIYYYVKDKQCTTQQ